MSPTVPHPALPLDQSDVEYEYGWASFPRPDVPPGTLTTLEMPDCRAFPGTERRVMVHVPAGIDTAVPQRAMIFSDADWYLDPARACRAGVVLDNLVHAGEIPPMVGVFVEPGIRTGIDDPDARRNRNVEYDSFDSRYADLLADEVLPLVEQHVRLSPDPDHRGLCGGSSSGNGSLTAAWHRPDAFRRVIGLLSSFAQIPGGNPFPALLATTPPKPLKVFLLAGHRDLQWNERDMNWFAENLEVAAALARAGYDMRLVVGDGGHTPNHGGVVLPDALRWLWRDAVPESTPLEELLYLAEWLEARGAVYQVNGGWAVDVHAGDQTRPHRDIDVFVDVDAVPDLLDWLTRWRGYAVEQDHLPVRLQLSGRRGRIDVHPMQLQSDGTGVQQGYDATFEHPAAGRTSVEVDGQAVCVGTPERLRQLRQGYPHRPVDVHDLAVLDSLAG